MDSCDRSEVIARRVATPVGITYAGEESCHVQTCFQTDWPILTQFNDFRKSSSSLLTANTIWKQARHSTLALVSSKSITAT